MNKEPDSRKRITVGSRMNTHQRTVCESHLLKSVAIPEKTSCDDHQGKCDKERNDVLLHNTNWLASSRRDVLEVSVRQSIVNQSAEDMVKQRHSSNQDISSKVSISALGADDRVCFFRLMRRSQVLDQSVSSKKHSKDKQWHDLHDCKVDIRSWELSPVRHDQYIIVKDVKFFLILAFDFFNRWRRSFRFQLFLKISRSRWKIGNSSIVNCVIWRIFRKRKSTLLNIIRRSNFVSISGLGRFWHLKDIKFSLGSRLLVSHCPQLIEKWY
jgi:hypothetical protein